MSFMMLQDVREIIPDMMNQDGMDEEIEKMEAAGIKVVALEYGD